MAVVKRSIAAAVSLLVLGLLTASTAVPSALAASRVARAPSFSADASAIRGHGELAVIDQARRLHLIGGAVRGARTVPLAGRANLPQWSHDGRWLAVTTQPVPPRSNPRADEPTTVWLVSRSGHVVRRLTPAGQNVYHAQAEWSPRADQLAMSYTAGVGTSSVTMKFDVVDTSGRARTLAAAPLISGFAWAPDGRRVAVAVNHFENAPGKWDSRLATYAARGGRGRTVTNTLGNVLDVAGWWPDGSGVLAWLDYQGSASLAADGLPLIDISVVNGHRRELTKTMLQYSGWLATSRLRDEVALVAGGDRELTGSHKHLVVCSRTRCHSVVQPKRRVTFDPAWSLDGRLAAVRDRAIPPTAANGYFTLRYTHKVEGSGGIDLVQGQRVRALAGAARATAPVWGGRGSMLFVRSSSLWLLTAGSASARRVAGPINSTDNFYGFVSWWDSFAWSGATG